MELQCSIGGGCWKNGTSGDVKFVFERGSNHGAGIGSSRFLDQDELPPLAGDPPNADDERRISQLRCRSSAVVVAGC